MELHLVNHDSDKLWVLASQDASVILFAARETILQAFIPVSVRDVLLVCEVLSILDVLYSLDVFFGDEIRLNELVHELSQIVSSNRVHLVLLDLHLYVDLKIIIEDTSRGHQNSA